MPPVLSCLRADSDTPPVPITPLTRAGFDPWLAGQTDAVRTWIAAIGFKAEPGATALLPGADGRLAGVVVGVAAPDEPWAFAGLPGSLPAGTYRIDAALDARAAERAAFGWALGAYAFTRYRTAEAKGCAALLWPEAAPRAAVERAVAATVLVRDLVNTPAADMGPAELAEAAAAVAGEFGARCEVIVGAELLERNYPAVHTVGRASSRAPRLVDITWGREGDPKVTLVGKGVCFDSGGLDIKPSNNMLLMKKDMGGAAHALALARMVMAAGLPVRLRLLIPAVENAVSGDAFRPLDVIRTRKGLTVEVGNTDAEGRLILCDALAEADAGKPALLLDFATLTGAARVALGTELPALFSNDDALAADLLACGDRAADPLWRLPLWQPYRKSLDSKVADLSSTGSSPFAGAVTAALFLESFVSKETPWAHLDIMAWNPSSRPGRPEGGEAMALRAAYAMIEKRFAGTTNDG